MATVTARFPPRVAGDRSAATRTGLLHRLFRAIGESRQRRADLEIAEILRRQGGVMADRSRLATPLRSTPYPEMPALQARKVS
jgi:hypothetical protein